MSDETKLIRRRKTYFVYRYPSASTIEVYGKNGWVSIIDADSSSIYFKRDYQDAQSMAKRFNAKYADNIDFDGMKTTAAKMYKLKGQSE